MGWVLLACWVLVAIIVALWPPAHATRPAMSELFPHAPLERPEVVEADQAAEADETPEVEVQRFTLPDDVSAESVEFLPVEPGIPSGPDSWSIGEPCDRISVVISEVNPLPTTASDSGMWIEVENISGREVALDGWRLLGAFSRVELPAMVAIGPGERIVLAEDQSRFARVHPRVNRVVHCPDLRLGTTSDLLVLTQPDGCVVDQAAYSTLSSTFRNDGLGLGPSLERDDHGHWSVSAGLGSPGQPNGVIERFTTGKVHVSQVSRSVAQLVNLDREIIRLNGWVVATPEGLKPFGKREMMMAGEVLDVVVGDVLNGEVTVYNERFDIVDRVVMREGRLNHVPKLALKGPLELEEGELYSRKLSLSDHDGHLMSVRLLETDVRVPKGLRVDALGVLSWRPSERFGPGRTEIEIEVEDSYDPPGVSRHRIEIVVHEVNQRPLIDDVGDQLAAENQAWSFGLSARDDDVPRQAIRWLLVDGPAGMVLREGQLFWQTPEVEEDKVFPVRVQVNDGVAQSEFAEFSILIRKGSGKTHSSVDPILPEPPAILPQADIASTMWRRFM